MANGNENFDFLEALEKLKEESQFNNVKEDAKKGDIRRAFSKSMKQRTVSRVLLNKFIKQVA